jgi:hypothetical protein
MRLVLLIVWLPELLIGQTLAPRPVDAIRTGAFANPEILESSGIARSRTLPHVLYTINDSGNPPALFAFDSTGRDLGQWRVPGVANVDWEAMAIGACPAGSCIVVADIGDNGERRPSVTLYRFREPTRLDRFRGGADPAPLDLDSLVFTYPDGPHDAEAIWVDPTGAVSVVTKGRLGGIRLFRLPTEAFGQGPPAIATLLQTLPIEPERLFGRWVTDAAMAPDGRHVAIRTYTELYLFPLLPTGRLGPPVSCNIAGLEPQGEGVEWLDATRLILTSEAIAGRGAAPIHVVRCRV